MWRMIDSLRGRDKNLLFPDLTVFWTTGSKFTSDILRGFFHDQGVPGANVI